MNKLSTVDSLYHFRAAYHGITTIHPFALLLLILCAIVMLSANRRYAVVPMLFLSCIVSSAQRIVIFGLDFDLLRVMVVTGWLRVLLKQETEGFAWKSIDKMMIAWAVSGAASYILLRGGAGDAVVNRLGVTFDSLGMYFLFRCLVRDMDDLKQLIIALAWLSLPVAYFLLLEQKTGRNMFSVLGGISEITPVREGKIRAQGAYPHSIIAGSCWVTQLPFFLALWLQDIKKWLMLAATAATLFIIYACSSSTPASGLAAVVVGFSFYMFRQQMSTVRWGLLATLVSLHLVMKAPVWHLIARIDLVGGSTGYHRFMLIDQTIRRFSEWWLFGTRYTGHWGHSLADTANMYVGQAVGGGFLTLLLFILLISLAFQSVGTFLSSIEDNSVNYFLGWALGVALFTHCMLFIGVAYFGQIILVWHLLLAVIGSLTPAEQITPFFLSSSSQKGITA